MTTPGLPDPATMAALGLGTPKGGFPRLTDAGNAKWLIILHGQDLRYCWPWKCWLAWVGTCWLRDATGLVYWFARDVAHTYYQMAAILNTKAADLNHEAAAEPDPAESQRLADLALTANKLAGVFTAHAKRCEARERINALVELARSEEGVPILPEHLDAHPMLLNTPSGTIELETETLREPRREDYLTQVTRAPCIPGATLPLWDESFEGGQPDPEVRRYMMKCVGRTLEGQPGADLIILQHGPGGTGKTTFQEAIKNALGDYAVTCPIETFSTGYRDSGGPRPDLASLRNKRMVTVPEAETAGDVVKMLKMLTGGEKIQARGLYQDVSEFLPGFVLWMRANRRPQVPQDDSGLWRRLREIPYTVRFTGDESIRQTLTNPDIAGAAILNWALEGHRLYRQEGLGPVPAAIAHATEEYQHEVDTLGAFLEECTTLVAPNAWTPRPDLWRRYQDWCRTADISRRFRLTRNAFYAQLEEKLGENALITRRGVRGFLGIGLLATRSGQLGDDEIEATQGALGVPGASFDPGFPKVPNAREENLETNVKNGPLSVGTAPEAENAPPDERESPWAEEGTV